MKKDMDSGHHFEISNVWKSKGRGVVTNTYDRIFGV
jgi:hypothetical protein